MTTASPFRRARAATCLLAGVALAAATAWHGIVMSSRNARPAVALMLDADEPIALGKAMTLQALPALKNKQPLGIAFEQQARLSLRSLALNPVALRFLAISGVSNSIERPNRRLLLLSDQISRRDVGTQMLLAADDSRRGNLKAVMQAYDKALRTSQAGRDLIYGPLGKLMSNPIARREFGLFFDQKASWLPSFLVVGLNQSDDPDAYFDLLVNQRKLVQLPNHDAVQDVLVNSLIAKNSFSNASKAFLLGRSGERAALISPTVNAVTLGGGRNTLYWFFPQNLGVNAAPFANRYLAVAAEPGGAGTVAQKLLFLSPGRYRLATKTDRSEVESGLGIDWLLQCLRDGSPARGEIPLTGTRSGTVMQHEFVVPRECQSVQLILRASRQNGTQNVSDRIIESIVLNRVN